MKAHRVLFVANFLRRGASYSASAELAAKLAQRGWKFTSTSHYANKVLRLADMLFTCIRARGRYNVANVSVFSGNAFVWAELTTSLLVKLGKPVVLTLHGGNLPQFASRYPLRVHRLLARAKAVTAPSGYLASQMARYRDGIEVIPNALDLRLYPFRLRERALPRLVWLRAFHDVYNPMLVPPVIAQLQNDFPDITIRMIGPVKDGSLEKTLAAASQLGVHDRITIVPGVLKEAVPGEISQGDIFLNTTNIDNQPVSVLEAMACGLCVVSTNVGGIPYLIDSGHNGLLCEPDDPYVMAKSIHKLLTEPELARQLSINGRKKAECSSWDMILPMWESLFSNILAGK